MTVVNREVNLSILSNLSPDLAEALEDRRILELEHNLPDSNLPLSVCDLVLSGTDSLLARKITFGVARTWDSPLLSKKNILDVGHEHHQDSDCHVKLLLEELASIASRSASNSILSDAACHFVLDVPPLTLLFDLVQRQKPRLLYCLFSDYKDWLIWLESPCLGEFVEFCAANGLRFSAILSNSFKTDLRKLISVELLGCVGSCFVIGNSDDDSFKQVVSYLQRNLMNVIRSLTGGPCVDELMMLKHSLLNFSNNDYIFSDSFLKNSKSSISDSFVVVGSGGSLDQNLDVIKSLQPSTWIVSAGSSIGTLLREGIVPDFHIHVERGWGDSYANDYSDVFSSFGNEELSSMSAVLPTSIHPSIHSLYRRSIFYSRGGQSPPFAFPFLRETCLKFEGPQCLSAAFAFVMHLCPREVFLVGADLGANSVDQARSLHAVGYSERAFKLVVPGNFSSTANTNRDMLFQASFMQSAFNSVSSKVCVYNLSDGIRLPFAAPWPRERVDDYLSSGPALIDKVGRLDDLLDSCSVNLSNRIKNQGDVIAIVRKQLSTSRAWLYKWSFLAQRAHRLDSCDLRIEASQLLNASTAGSESLVFRIFRGSLRDGFWLTARCVERHVLVDSQSEACWNSFSRFVDSLISDLKYFEAIVD